MYSDMAYGFMPHYDQGAALVEHYAPTVRPPPPSQQPPPPPPPTYPSTAAARTLSSSMHARAEPPTPSGRPFLGSAPQYGAGNAPPFPTTVDDMRHLMDAVSQRTTAGLIAASKIRYWMKERQGARPSNEVEVLLRQYRVPQWFREEYEPLRAARARERARLRESGAVISRPPPEGPYHEWVNYLNNGPEPNVLQRHVRRNPTTNRVEDTDLHGYLTAGQLAFVESPGVEREDKRTLRTEVFRLLAQIFMSESRYREELAAAGCAVHPELKLSAYTGPIPPTLGDVTRHAANCGVSPDTLYPDLTAWATQFNLSVVPAPETAVPAAEANEPTNEPVALAPGGNEPESTSTVAPSVTEASTVASTEDVTMLES